MNGKRVLDACCGSRMFWFDKNNDDVVFNDIRVLEEELCDGRTLKISPDVVSDFRDMPFEDNSFYMVVFDPPHLIKVGENSWLAKKYGKLTEFWETEISQGFNECMRVLKPNGTLIFKWNEDQIKVSQVIKAIGVRPLFGHKSGRNSKTLWMAFIK